MDAKTIGSFIAALRRAAGMTQRDFADRLNVSDKTVSRWERDESTPDLSLIPIIAEIFGVTCDELLRGERKSPAVGEDAQTAAETTDSGNYSAKAEKRRRFLIRTALTHLRSQSWLASADACLGLLLAMVINIGMLRAYIGFFCAAVFSLSAIMLEAIFTNRTLSAVTEDSADTRELGEFRYRVYRMASPVFVLSVVLLAFSLPLLLLPGDAYVGLSAGSWMLWGLRFAAAAAILCGIVLYFVQNALYRRALMIYPDRDSAVIIHRRRMQKRCFLLCAGLLAATALLHGILTRFGDTYAIAGSTSFDDIDSFVAFMEQDVPYAEDGITYMNDYGYAVERIPAPESAIAAEEPSEQFYDADGNPITEEEARRRTITDKDGNVIVSYLARNESVVSISHGAPGEDSFLPIYVKTRADVTEALRQVQLYGAVFTVLYSTEVLLCVFLYFLFRNPRRAA